mmetsp:Transcript_3262/g.4050  ORF Transcript_3262/g.4050 Transcript_3262/m.4050 type:complete len:97 (-) Transcript_3262:112-402(-)
MVSSSSADGDTLGYSCCWERRVLLSICFSPRSIISHHLRMFRDFGGRSSFLNFHRHHFALAVEFSPIPSDEIIAPLSSFWASWATFSRSNNAFYHL